MQVYPYGRYRQLNSILYINNHKLKSSKIFAIGNLKVGKPRFFLQNSIQIPSLEALRITHLYANSLKKYVFMKCIDWERKDNFN